MGTSRTLLLAAAAFYALTASAQTPADSRLPSFEVASIRQNKAGGAQHSNVPLDSGNVYSAIDPSDTRTSASGYFVATNQPLWRFIVFAYKLSGTQELALRFSSFEGLKSKAPSWVTGGFDAAADRFNIEARAGENTSIEQIRLMMQALLAERFQLVVHRESRDAPAFGLVLARAGTTGPDLKPHPASDACAPIAGQPAGEAAGQADKPASGAASGATAGVGDLPPVCGVIAHVLSAEDTRSSFGGRGVSLSLLATSLPTMTGMATISRPVVDQTGLTGLYDLTLHWKASTDPETGDNAAFFRAALRDQLGLELKPTHAPIEILVIDHVERPSEN